MQERRLPRNIAPTVVAVACLVFLLSTPSSPGAVKTWTGTGQNWNTANWSPSAPVAGDDVVINGDIELTNATVILGSYTLSATYTHEFIGTNGLILATNVTIQGTVTHSNVSVTAAGGGGEWTPDQRVHIRALSNLTVSAGGSIAVDAAGYRTSYGENTGPGGYDGYGPGAGLQYYGGGGHGGHGGGDVNGGDTNGSVTAPFQAGSSGGGHSAGHEGGAGGGVVRVEAGNLVTISGTVSAQGEDGHGLFGAGGAGGSIYITCATVDGTGLVRASGGFKGTNLGGGGGGGRIAVVYTNGSAQAALSPQVTFQVFDREGVDSVGVPHNSELGTLYFPDADVLPRENMIGGFHLIIPGFTTWAPGSLTISNATVRFDDGLAVSVTNQVRIDHSGGLDLRGHSTLECADLLLDNGATLALRTHSDLACSGDATITNGAAMHVYAGATNGTGGYGATVGVTGTLSIATASFLYPHAEPTNGGAVRITVGSVLVASGGAIDANGIGYKQGRGENTGPSGYDGYGPGAGLQYYGGGGHGGAGGAHPGFPANAGGTYGVADRPVHAGSSGGGHSVSHRGGAGGGAVIIRTASTGTIRVDGTVSADGDPGGGSFGSGGAGGSVYIDCGTFAGGGLIRARGGPSGSAVQPSGGGGGRVAVWRVLDTWSGTALQTNVVVAGGSATGGGGLPGTNGTVFIGQNAEPYGPPAITNLAATNLYATSVSLNGSVIVTGQTITTVYVFWGETDGGTNWGTWDNTNAFPGYPGTGPIATNVALAADTGYAYRFYATNAGGDHWAEPVQLFNSGAVWFEETDPAASEDGPLAATLTVHRAAWATNVAITVDYSVTGDASNGVDYTMLDGSVDLGLGVSNAPIVITPIPDAEPTESPEDVVLQILPDADRTYVIGSMNTATATIANAVPAASNLWSGTGYWTNGSQWSENYVPVAGQHVVVTGHVTLGLTTPVFASYVLAPAATNTFEGTNAILRATNITVNGAMTHTVVTTTNANPSGDWLPNSRVYLLAEDAVTLTASSTIDVDALGYPTSYGEHTGPSGHDGYGPGAGLQYYGGGGHGGRGGGEVNGGATNGSASAPFQAGSSGSGHSAGREGGAGGGVVRIEAGGQATIDGTISAEGENGHGAFGSGGAGGSIYLAAATIAGNGLLRANGGTRGVSLGGGGGGGRIALVYTNSAAQGALPASLRFGVLGREGQDSLSVPANSEFGTLYFPGDAFLPREEMSGGFQLVIPGFPSWTPGSVTVTNGEVIFFNALDLHVANDVHMHTDGGLGLGGGGLLHCDNLRVDSGSVIRLDQGAGLVCRTDLIVTNGGALHATAAPTNGVTEEYGQLLVVSNHMVVASGSTVYPHSDEANGGSPKFVVRDLTIASGGMIDTTGLGFLGGRNGVMGWRAPLGNGAGLGNGQGYGAGLYFRGGGGYGGQGGEGNVAGHYGLTYGSSNAPAHPGSGGGYGGGGNGGNGGGLVRVEADREIRVDGTITADGAQGSLPFGPGGSGGGIYLYCITFSGTGELRANGADGIDGTYGGGGGGGRIAVWRYRHQWTGTSIGSNSVSPGANASTGVATPDYGTVFLGDVPVPSGTLIVIR